MTTTDIKSDGQIEVRVETQGKVWRGIIEPGDYARAAEFGITDLSAWAPEVLAAWEAQKPPAPTLAKLKTQAVARINSDAQTRILIRYPLWVQTNCANGIYPTALVAQMKADIVAVITAANTAQDAINAATDEAGVNAVTAVWPVI